VGENENVFKATPVPVVGLAVLGLFILTFYIIVFSWNDSNICLS
jgi:hypothetical protein